MEVAFPVRFIGIVVGTSFFDVVEEDAIFTLEAEVKCLCFVEECLCDGAVTS